MDDLGDTSGEENALKLFEHSVDLPLALLKILSDLGLFNISPLASFTIFILLEVVIELPQQVLIGTLLEDLFQLSDTILVGIFFTAG